MQFKRVLLDKPKLSSKQLNFQGPPHGHFDAHLKSQPLFKAFLYELIGKLVAVHLVHSFIMKGFFPK